MTFISVKLNTNSVPGNIFSLKHKEIIQDIYKVPISFKSYKSETTEDTNEPVILVDR